MILMLRRKTRKEIMMDKNDFIRYVKDATKFIFNKEYEISPCIIAFKDNNFVYIPLEGLDKDNIAQMILQFRNTIPLMTYISEAWAVNKNIGDEISVAPSKDPNRIEVVLCNLYFSYIESMVIMAKIIREPGCPAVLDDWETLERMSLSGRFHEQPRIDN